uniref:Uncharacterized protein n=1 Tax=viral metagenome TaxID=1070528 RepID=A0A6M3JLK4_9ZZZZ
MLTLTKDEIENSVYRNSDLKKTALELYAKLAKAEAELTGLKKIIAAANSTASMAHYGGYIKGYIK